ncbi:TetR/AcrR family transcriptional regulator [Streptomyces albidoflavus]|uniref:TetR/AcrR family transcriptional regulator n=1 Tax=Streptomyces albidoflavus TaxID=1886 RepID=UPI0008F54550|nr:TetR family transcriptional regulator [Streptomyces albidoflavus]
MTLPRSTQPEPQPQPPETPQPPQRHPGGRRPGENRTREQILDAARECFAERGYDATSVRRIAETAGVDQALVHHFYGTKEKLFLNALEIPLRMPEALAEAAAGDRVGLGSRIVLAHLRVWEDASARPAMMTTLRSAATHRSAAAVLRDYAKGSIREALGKVITGEDVELRIALIATTLIGLSLTRHLVRLDPVPDTSPQELAARLGPVIDLHLDPVSPAA